MRTTAKIRRKDAPAALAASGRFGGFKPESERGTRTMKVDMNPAIEAMKKAWAECEEIDHADYDKSYAMMLGKIKPVSAKDIASFSIALVESQGQEGFGYKAGLFLSALIESSKEDDFTIHTAHLDTLVHNLGYRNTKNVTVEGSVGHSTASSMEKGIIIVEGDVGESTGYKMKGGILVARGNSGGTLGQLMEGGEIIVNGNSDYGLGWGMKNGAITVNGDAARQAGFGMEGGRITIRGNGGEFIGDSMKGGEIHLFQEDPDVASILGGKIFLEGKLIAEK